VATGKVVGSVLLAADQLLGVEQLAVGASAHLIDHGGLQVEEDAAGDVLASTGLGEEGVEGIITTADGLVARHLCDREGVAGQGGAGVSKGPRPQQANKRSIVPALQDCVDQKSYCPAIPRIDPN